MDKSELRELSTVLLVSFLRVCYIYISRELNRENRKHIVDGLVSLTTLELSIASAYRGSDCPLS